MVTASFTVLLYQLTVGPDYDADTGVYLRHYNPLVARIAIVPKNVAQIVLGAGFYGKNSMAGITAYEVNEGDIIEVTYQTTGAKAYWQIMNRQPVPFGDVHEGYFLGLDQMQSLPFVAPFPGGPPGSGVYIGYDPAFYDSTFYDYRLLITVP
jgi:hypothetical protein